MNDIEIEVPRAPRGIERLGIHAQHNFDAAGMALAIIEAVSKSPQSEEDLKETVKGAVSLFKEAIESL